MIIADSDSESLSPLISWTRAIDGFVIEGAKWGAKQGGNQINFI
jgi:hypothetical protein